VRCELAGPDFSLRLDAASPMPDLGVPTESTPFDRPWANRLPWLLSTWRHPRAVAQGLPSFFCLGGSSDGSPMRRHQGTEGVVLGARLRRAGLGVSVSVLPDPSAAVSAGASAPAPPAREPSSAPQRTNVASHEARAAPIGRGRIGWGSASDCGGSSSGDSGGGSTGDSSGGFLRR
jgi:hypothetical protein